MKLWIMVLCLLLACAGAQAAETAWQPSAGHVQLPLWPGTPPDMKAMPESPQTATLRL